MNAVYELADVLRETAMGVYEAVSPRGLISARAVSASPLAVEFADGTVLSADRLRLCSRAAENIDVGSPVLAARSEDGGIYYIIDVLEGSD